jgi:hypothetical protein
MDGAPKRNEEKRKTHPSHNPRRMGHPRVKKEEKEKKDPPFAQPAKDGPPRKEKIAD